MTATTRIEQHPDRGTRPCFIDGLRSTRTYLVIAAHKIGKARRFNTIGIRNCGYYYRVHAYPDFGYFNLPTPEEAYRRTEKGYQGAHMNAEQINQLITRLKNNPDIVVIDTASRALDKAAQGFATGDFYDQ